MTRQEALQVASPFCSMKKIIIAALVFISISLIFTGCDEPKTVNVNVESDSSISGTAFGKSALIEIGDRLWYDSTTRIVYWWNGYLNGGDCATTPSPYYAPNGLPYRYNPETNTFEECKLEVTE